MIDYTQFAFIFDMDGTLVDNMRFHTIAWQKMLDENGIIANTNDFLVKTAGKTNREIIPTIFPDASEEEISAFADRKESLYRESFLPHRKTVEGTIEFLTESKRLGIKMAVATAAPVANMEFILDGLDLRKFFDAITTAEDVKNGKPDPEVFLVSADKLGVLPRNSIVFEDAIGGFEAAHRAGMKSVGIATVNSIEDMLKLDSVVEAQNDFLGLNPQEIIERYVPLFARTN
jgi:beta-phosphoglucomutase family hydrolase